MVTDVGHPRAQNKKSTWRRANQQAFQFLSAHIEGSHEQQTTVSSEPTVCELGGESDQETAPSDRLSAQTPEEPSAGRLLVRYGRGDTLLFTSGADDPNGPASDPISATISGQVGPGECVTSPAPPPEDSYSEISRPLGEDTTYVGLGTVDVDYTFVGLSGQLDARVWDVPPDPRPAEECPSGEPREGCPVLITRGTYRLRSDRPTDLTPQQLEECAKSNPPGDECPTQTGTLRVPLLGNHWRFAPGHRIRLDLLQVDSPFLRASTSPSSVSFGPPTLNLPTRKAGERELPSP